MDGNLRIDEIEIFGKEVKEDTHKNTNSDRIVVCEIFALWKRLDNQLIHDHNPYSLIDNKIDTCIPIKFLTNYAWRGIFLRSYEIVTYKIALDLRDTPSNIVFMITYSNHEKYETKIVPLSASRNNLRLGKNVIEFSESLSFHPDCVYFESKNIVSGYFCEIQFIAEKDKGDKHTLMNYDLKFIEWRNTSDYQNKVNCEEDGILRDKSWNPLNSKIMRFQYKDGKYPWIMFNLGKSYDIKQLFISYKKSIKLIDISVLGTSRGIEYLDKSKFPFNSQRIICITKMNLTDYSSLINCRNNAIGTILSISTFNIIDPFDLSELRIMGKDVNFNKKEVLLRTKGEIKNGDLIRFDTLSNITGISIRFDTGISEKIIIYPTNNHTISTDKLLLNQSIIIDLNYLGIKEKNNNILYPISIFNINYLYIQGNLTDTLFLRIFGTFQRGG